LDTDELEASLSRVRAASLEVVEGDAASQDLSLKEIFRLNNVIGKLARTHPEKLPHLKALQGDVNLITVGVKNGRRKDIDEGLALTEEAIAGLSKI
jgi:hypothetical protein